MAYQFTEAQLQNIQAAVDLVKAEGTNWSRAYKAVEDALAEALAGSDNILGEPFVLAEDRANVDAVHVWLKGAAKVNSGEGGFSALIRGYTLRQKQLHLGTKQK